MKILIKGTIFPYDILFSSDDPGDTAKYIEKKLKYKLSANEKKEIVEVKSAKGRTVQLENNQIVIWVKKEKTKIGFNLPTLVHELVHAIFFILDTVGIKQTEQTDEVYAYYMAYLTTYILNRVDK